MSGFGFGNVGFVGTLLPITIPTVPLAVSPTGNYGRFPNTAFKFPTMPGVKTIVFYIRRVSQGSLDYTSYLVDNRPDGVGFIIGNGHSSIAVTAGGVSFSDYGFAAFSTGAWVKVSLQVDSFPDPYLFCRYTMDGILASYDIAELRTYSRALTAAEAADATGAWPTDSLVSRYDFSLASATAVPDALTGAYPLALIGQAGTLAVGPAAVATGPSLPALNWLSKFYGDTGLTNQVSGGPNLVATGATAPALAANAYGMRAAWTLNIDHPDYFDLSLVNPISQHWLVAVVLTASAYGPSGSMLLGASVSNPALYWQIGQNDNFIYGQAGVVSSTGSGVPLQAPVVLVFYVAADGQMRLWKNGHVYVGSAATAISAQTLPLQIGKYPGGQNWNYGGLLGAHCIAGGTYTDADAASVGQALQSYYGIS